MVKQAPTYALVLILCLLGQIVSATEVQSLKEIVFNGQEQEAHKLNNELTEVRYKVETRDSTCYRQVPYQDTECEMVPEYDTVCETIPGREDCHTEYDNECRTETDYRRECTRSPDREQCRNERRTRKECERGSSRRQCRTVRRTRRECRTDNSRRNCRTEPAREQCRTNSSGQRRCRTIPARQICENKPEQVCRDVPYTEQECETVPGEVTCRQVPYTERVCHTVPGEESCRNVPYSNQVCEDVPRQACEWIPSRQDCRTVQVGENQVCRDVTRYRQESYACQEEVKVPYTVTLKQYNLDAKLMFSVEEGYEPSFKLTHKLNTKGKSKFLMSESGDTKPVGFISSKEKRSEDGKLISIEGRYKFKILNGGELKKMISKVVEQELTKDTLSFALAAHDEIKTHTIHLTLLDNGQEIFSRKLEDKEIVFARSEDKVSSKINLDNIGVKLKSLHKYGYKLFIKPIFKSTLSFPAADVFKFKDEGVLYTFDKDDLERLKDELSKLDDLKVDTDKLSFTFPNHDFISDAKISIKVGDVFDRELSKDELSWEVGTEKVLVQVPFGDIGVDLSPIKKSDITITVKYVFDENAPLPKDYKHSASLNRSLVAKLGKVLVRKLKEDIQVLENVELFKYSLKFKLKKNELLTGFNFKLKVSKKDNVKIDRMISKEDVSITEAGDFIQVKVSFKKFGAKISKWGKHFVSIELEHTLNTEIQDRTNLDLTKSFGRELEAK